MVGKLLNAVDEVMICTAEAVRRHDLLEGSGQGRRSGLLEAQPRGSPSLEARQKTNARAHAAPRDSSKLNAHPAETERNISQLVFRI